MTTIKKAFSLPILGALLHSEKTREILAPYVKKRKQSEHVRQAILRFAGNKGFRHHHTINDNYKPLYVSKKSWQQIKRLQRKSYYIDYTFLVAFYWLQQLPEFDGYNKSKLIREIIETSNDHL